jgi:hypothetical protein
MWGGDSEALHTIQTKVLGKRLAHGHVMTVLDKLADGSCVGVTVAGGEALVRRVEQHKVVAALHARE